MNYRHHYHAGNFADVMKHALLVRLVRALQRKDTGWLALDTHAGRGVYDLERAAAGHTLARQPEWPDGIGRLWTQRELPPAMADYVALVRDFDSRRGNLTPLPRFYPGSPWLLRVLARTQDRVALCEKQADECNALRAEFSRTARVSVHEIDGYAALRAMLPPAERRGLVLIDPPFEAPDEFATIAAGLGDALRRFSTGVFAIWYPLTERARINEFFAAVQARRPPPTLAAELSIAGDRSALKLKGCGLLVVNPPWQFERDAAEVLTWLSPVLAREEGSGSRVEWVVRE